MNAFAKIVASRMSACLLIAGAIMLAMMLVAGQARAELSPKDQPFEFMYALGAFNGVYSEAGRNLQVRVSLEEKFYITVGNVSLGDIEIIDVSRHDRTMTFLVQEDGELKQNTFRRFRDGVMWIHGDGSRTDLLYARRLTNFDAIHIACNAYTPERLDKLLKKHPQYSCK